MDKPVRPIDRPQWVIFDGDNTLWALEPLYDSARIDFCRMLSQHEFTQATGKSERDIEEYQRQRDRELYSLFGYSSCRFARSFEDTIRYVLPARSERDLASLIQDARRIAAAVFTGRAQVFPQVGDLLLTLRSCGIRIGLLTSGELWVQRKRCQEFPYIRLFDWLKITEGPKEDVLRELTSRYNVPAAGCLFVGDSLTSDVFPALRNGLAAVWVAHPNWDREQAHGTEQVEKDQGQLLRALERERLDATKAYLIENIADLFPLLQLSCSIPARQSESPPLLAYGVFEGGGAKGLAHLGAHRACVERNITFLGVAGTSAGSIAAGLIAIDCTPDDLFRLDGGGAFDIDHHNVLGTRAWNRAKRIFARPSQSKGPLSGKPHNDSISSSVIHGAIAFAKALARLTTAPIRTVQALTSWGLLLLTVLRNLGYFSTQGFRDWYNKTLFDMLPADFRAEHFPGANRNRPPDVTFRHVEYLWRDRFEATLVDRPDLIPLMLTNGCPLKIVSTDVTRQRLCVHPDDSDLDLAVADAVAASIAIPFVFQAKVLTVAAQDTYHVDGGALSNFPAWLFQNRLGISGPIAPVLGFELTESGSTVNDAAAPRQRKLLGFSRDLVSTVVAGSKRLSTRSIPELYSIPIHTSVSPYAFDQNPARRLKTYKEGHEQVRAYFETAHLLVTQEQIEPVLARVHRDMLAKIGKKDAHLRVNVVARNEFEQLHVRYRFNMDFDPDDHLHFELEEGGGVGLSWNATEPLVIDLEDARQTFAEYRMSKYEQALVRPTLRSLLSAPVFDVTDSTSDLRRKRKWGILNFDSDDDLLSEFRSAEIQKLATDQAQQLALTWFTLLRIGRKI